MKNLKNKNIRSIIGELDALINRARKFEKKYNKQLSRVSPNFTQSARNLIHYRALRMTDNRDLQKKLGDMGLSRLAKAESHVMASLLATKSYLSGLIGELPPKKKRPDLTFKKSKRIHKTHAKALLGYRSKGRRTRIMVTLPTEAAQNYQLVHDMIANGMNCARINCAHDNEETWKKMISHVRKASVKLKRKCQVAMDLGGPKIRTGNLTPGPKIRKFRPTKDIRGKIIRPAEIWLSETPHPDFNSLHLPIIWNSKLKLEKGSQLYFRDTRGKKRSFIVIKVTKNGCLVHCFKTAYLETGMTLYTHKNQSSDFMKVGELPPIERPILLHKGDKLRVHKANLLGEPAQYNADNKLLSYAHISTTAPEIFKGVKIGEPIFLDDGQIEGHISQTSEDEFIFDIIHTKSKGGKLRADKGINLPSSNLQISGLTKKDKKDLKFVVKHADVVNLSFVNNRQDVRDLINELDQLNAKNKIGIILKIETQSGFNNLIEILLEAMQVYPIGVMIARGDLAIESGWNNIGRIQEEILSLCLSANISDIWATQVLENLAKQGIPSRAEITDAVMSQRADCVMLNKGSYILQSIHLLDTILKEMRPYRDKNAPLLPKMKPANIKVL